MNESQIINIACACDQTFLPYTAGMLSSVFENNKNHTLRIFLIFNDIPRKEIDQLQRLIQRSNHLFSPLKVNKSSMPDLLVSQHISIATYFRLLIPRLLPDSITKVIYLDGDMIVRKDIQPLWDMNLSDYPLAAVQHSLISTGCERLGMKKTSGYFNSGVMVLNLNYWRKNNLPERVIKFIHNNPKIIRNWDQDGLNAIVDGNFLKLPTTWNVTSRYFFDDALKNEYTQLLADPYIVHFTGMGRKPWQYSFSHPYKKEYVQYQNKTPWKVPIFNSYLNFLYKFAKNIKKQLFS